MTWPSSPSYATTDLDNPADSPASARDDLLAALQDLSAVIAGPVPVGLLPEVHGFRSVEEITATGTTNWTVPAGVTRILVMVAGAGGGGGGSDQAIGSGWSGGGGGGGGVVLGILDVVAGNTVVVAVGSQGAAGVNATGSDGGDGNDSTVTYGTIVLTADGGAGGDGYYNGSNGGAPGYGSAVNTTNYVALSGGAGQGGEDRGGNGGDSFLCGNSADYRPHGAGGGGSRLGAGSGPAPGSHGGCVIMY